MHGKYLDIQSLSAPINFYLSKIYQVKKINMHKSYSLLGLDYKQMSAVYQQMLLIFFFLRLVNMTEYTMEMSLFDHFNAFVLLFSYCLVEV